MKTIPPAQAEHQLTHVADRFDEWRQTRTTRAEPIPQHLWEQAIALTALFAMTHLTFRTLFRTSEAILKESPGGRELYTDYCMRYNSLLLHCFLLHHNFL
jgi:hypothetical protein